MHAERSGFDLAILRLGIVYGPSPAEHDNPESQTVVDKFRRLAERGEPLPLDDGGKATIGVAHVEDVARIMLRVARRERASRSPTWRRSRVTVADVAALARGEQPGGSPACSFETPVQLPVPARRLHGAAPRDREVPRHRGDRLPRLAFTASCCVRRGTRSSRSPARAAPSAAAAADLDAVCASTPASPDARRLVAGCDAVLHFAGVPGPGGSAADPAAAVRAERRHDPEPARRLPRAWRRPRLPLDRSRRGRAARPTPTRSRSGWARRPAAFTARRRPSCG